MSENGRLKHGELVESRVSINHKDYEILPGDTLKIIEVGAVDGEERIVVEPLHLTGTRLTLAAATVRRSQLPDNFLDLDEVERATLGGLGDLNNVPEDVVWNPEDLPDTDEIDYE